MNQVVQAMPPRKKAKAKHVVGNVVSGPDTVATPTSITEAPGLIKTTLAIIEDMFNLRRADEKRIHTEPLSHLQPKDGVFSWPVMHGGTFKQIAQRAWSNPDQLIDLSASLTNKIGFTESGDPAEFLQEFCKMEAGLVLVNFVVGRCCQHVIVQSQLDYSD